jgi:NADP-dependent aldehyde dehydrogenase
MTLTIPATSTEEVTALVGRAAAAAKIWAATSPAERKRALDAIADRLDGAVDSLIPLAMEETNLGETRLQGELKRTTFQLRLFGTTIEEGSYLDVRIDPADPEWPMGVARPDIRRQLEPLGPVVVFSASNFPFAFSGAGGDTASALAAGCPVILKAHSGHPRLTQATGELVEEALQSVGAPEGLFAVIFGTESGKAALKDPRVKAGSFTGSIPGGRALFDIANSRPEPIPFYGELGSVNPVFVTEAAAAARAQEIAEGFLGSVSMSAGQFCTKPGVLFVPEGSGLPELLQTSKLAAPAPLLNSRIQDGFTEVLQEMMAHPDVKVLASAGDALADPPAPSLLITSVDRLLADPESLFRECFGPAAMVVTYTDENQLLDVAATIDGQLTGTIQGEPGDHIAPELVRILATKAGRLLWNQWPTGVSVTYAQQHGGPYPATTASTYTSVGTAAIARFLRPVAYQNFPQELLPQPLQDSSSGQVPQRINGQAHLPA